jgi:hypothetical protein
MVFITTLPSHPYHQHTSRRETEKMDQKGADTTPRRSESSECSFHHYLEDPSSPNKERSAASESEAFLFYLRHEWIMPSRPWQIGQGRDKVLAVVERNRRPKRKSIYISAEIEMCQSLLPGSERSILSLK